MKFLSKLKGGLRGQTVLLRVDFNVEGVHDALRLCAVLPTIKFLLNRKAKIIILSHRGRPTRKTPSLSLKFCLKFLEKNVGRKITFLSTIPDKLPMGELFVLENLRFWPGEDDNDIVFARKLAELGNVYVNDAFGVSHRANASVTRLPKLLPAYAGLLLEKEIKTLSSVMRSPRQPLVLIFGGAKVGDKIPVVKKLLPKTSVVLLGSSVIGDRSLLPKSNKILWPIDWLAEKDRAFDIGPLTVDVYGQIIKKAGTIIWNGPVGRFEDKKFAAGSMSIANLIARSNANVIIGGGETTTVFQMSQRNHSIRKNIFLSTGGGAMLALLSGKKLPGIEALK
ncbi:MAG: phosphoglycerate kinase [bacterium]|nr:phosphoglycerate kinase [bacterium]